VQFDGKVVFSGYMFQPTGFFTARFEPDGDLDPTFGQGGVVSVTGLDYASVDGMLLQDDGKILVSGVVEAQSGNNTAFVRRMLCTSCASSIGEVAPAVSNLSVFPNPAAERIQVQFTSEEPGAFSVMLFQSDGKLKAILQPEQTFAAGEHVLPFFLPQGLEAGMYQVVVQSAYGVSVLPLVVR
jgi:hypothetical protein